MDKIFPPASVFVLARLEIQSVTLFREILGV